MTSLSGVELHEDMVAGVDERTRDILETRRRAHFTKRRGWLVRRMLLLADVVGLLIAFAVAASLHHPRVGIGPQSRLDLCLFVLALPSWVVAAKLYGLYDQDEERTDHSTADDIAGVFHLVTVATWLFTMAVYLTHWARPGAMALALFWATALVAVTGARVCARAVSRRNIAYLQNTIIVGAGQVGQLVARKLLQHPEYGINLVGFVDAEPTARREDLQHLTLLGGPEKLLELVRLLDVERVIFAFSRESNEDTLGLIRELKDFDVQIDVVPRLFEIVGPSVGIHTVEGLPLVGLPPVRLSRSSRLIKRWIDVLGAIVALVLTAPFFLFAMLRIKLDSPGPVFFRQRRLGFREREFTAFKFRTMRDGVDPLAHAHYVETIMDSRSPVPANGVYKLDQDHEITRFGRWLRRSSLDELPQLFNVLRGDMSLVGPRPCLPYETKHFAPHHFERFLVPAGMTGFWQVTARSKVTFGEALDMDVAYVRSWSPRLDLWLLVRTPIQVLRRMGAA
ncbi:MAG: sugar transferase [Actinomycetota bacterium]